ncbi:T9SS type A sorting domain-containing protein [bacterium]|nr:T9SS type A sorting domain-containing protein [bacterium]
MAQAPAYQTTSWSPASGPIGGLGYDIRYSFSDYNRWYVTDAFSGFYISEDRGLTWRSSNSGILEETLTGAVPVFCATVDPHDPSVIWAGMQNFHCPVFKSTDAGESWQRKETGIDLAGVTVRGFTVHPRNPDIVYAMAEWASAEWTPDKEPRHGLDPTIDMTKGLVYKTVDGGEHWTEIWRGNNLARYCWIHPRHPDTLYVSTGIFDREAANTDTAAGIPGGVGILKSTDGGQTWQVFDQANGLQDLYIGSLAMHPLHPDTLYAAAGHAAWSNHQGRRTAGLYMAVNGGETWTRILPDNAESRETFLVVECSPADPRVIYTFTPEAVYRSDDDGAHWNRFSRETDDWGPPGIIVGFPIDAQGDPEDPMRVIVNNYLGGNVVSADGGEHWVTASDGYTGALVRHLAVTAGGAARVYAGSRSGVYASPDGGESWEGRIYTPTGMDAKFNEILGLAVDRHNPDHLMTFAADFPCILVSDNGGMEWEISTMVGDMQAMRFAPSDGAIAYAATRNGFFRSENGGHAFLQVNGDTIATQLTALEIHPDNPGLLWALTKRAGFVSSEDGGEAWIARGTGLPGIRGTCLAVHPLNSNLMYAGFAAEGQVGGNGLYRSLDGGLTWTQMTAGLEPNALIKDIIVDRTRLSTAYCCDQFTGVYATNDSGETWFTINEGLKQPAVNVLALSFDGTVLYAGTEGNGVCRLGDPGETAVPASRSGSPEGPLLHPAYPNPFNAETVIRYELDHTAEVTIDIINARGRILAVLVDSEQGAGSYRISWQGRDRYGNGVGSGVYFCRFRAGHHTAVQKMILVR